MSSPTLSEKFSTNLLAARRRARMSQDTLAKKAGLSVSYVSMLERGRRSAPLETIEAFATALGVAPVKLLQ